MKKTFNLKTFFLLWALLAGFASAHAEDFDYEWVKVTDLTQVASGDLVLLVDESKNIALPNNDESFKGVAVTISDGKIADENTAALQWTVTKNSDDTYTFTTADNHTLSFPMVIGNSLRFDAPDYSAFSYFSDLLGKQFGSNTYCIQWQGAEGNYSAIWGDVRSGEKAYFSFYKKVKKLYVKWKRVDGLWVEHPQPTIPLKTNDTIVVVDLKTGKAMSNDKGEKAPDAVAVTLNDSKDRIIDKVVEKVLWKFFLGNTLMTTDGTQQLYTDSKKGLKVGNIEEINDDAVKTFSLFSKSDAYYPYFTIDDTEYQFYLDDSMFSSWELKEINDQHFGDGLAFFKRVEDPKKLVTIELAEYYEVDLNEDPDYNELDLEVNITGAEQSNIIWSSSNTNVATVEDGVVYYKKRGTTVITASVAENSYHDKASAKCTLIVDDLNSEEPGSINHPLTVAQAKELAENGEVTVSGTKVNRQEGVNYYIKGKVSKVNSGLMAMFGDMDFGEMMGNIGGSGGNGSGMNLEEEMDDIDFDMDEMEESGFDMSSMGFDMSSMGFDMSAMFNSDQVTYYISDDGTKDGQLKVLNGRGEFDENHFGVITYQKMPKLSPGDCVIVRGPLVETEDSNMFAGMMGNGDDEPKTSWKVGELNYLFEYDPTLLAEDTVVYINKTLDSDGLYTIDNIFDCSEIELEETKIRGGMQEPTFKSSDEEIAKWDSNTKTIIGVKEGKAKITVKMKVIVAEDNPNTDDNEEKSYTMKRKFKVNVLTRDLEPAGKYAGDYVLTTNTSDLKDGTRLILVGTRVKDDKETDYVMVGNNAMMGGGKNGSKITIEDPSKELIPCEDVPKGTLEVVLEKAEDNTSWYLNIGKDENDNDLYLYASDTSEEEQGDEQQGDEQQGGNSNKFDAKKLMEMFSPSSGLKVGTKEEAGDSLKATISFEGNIATIKYTITEGKNNTIMLASSFDMEEMMNMFGEMGNQENEEGGNSNSSSFDMGSFDMFMASFNTKKSGDEKSIMPRIYRFVADPTFDISIGSTAWRTIVTYNNVAVPDNIKAYVVTEVNNNQEENTSWAKLKEVEDKQLKGGEPYLLHRISGGEWSTLTVLDPELVEVSAPEPNLLQVSGKTIAGEHGNTSVYVLANKSAGVGFYRWIGGILGSGRVYLPVEASIGGANEFCAFNFEQPTQTTSIQSIEDSKANEDPLYDLQGRRVQPQQKGIYITNGKKVVLK